MTCALHNVVCLFHRGDPAGPRRPLVVSRRVASGLHDHQWHTGAKDGSSLFHRNALPCQLGVSLPKGKSPATVSHLFLGWANLKLPSDIFSIRGESNDILKLVSHSADLCCTLLNVQHFLQSQSFSCLGHKRTAVVRFHCLHSVGFSFSFSLQPALLYLSKPTWETNKIRD